MVLTICCLVQWPQSFAVFAADCGANMCHLLSLSNCLQSNHEDQSWEPTDNIPAVGMSVPINYRFIMFVRSEQKRLNVSPLKVLTEVEVEVNLIPAVSRPGCLGVGHPSGTRDQFLFLFEIFFRHLQVCYFVAPSLTRGRVCNLLVQLLLGFARAVTLGSKSLRSEGHILLSHLRLPQPGGPGPRIYIPQQQGGPDIPPGTGFPFRRLLRLAGLRWRYSTPPPHGSEGTSSIATQCNVDSVCPRPVIMIEPHRTNMQWTLITSLPNMTLQCLSESSGLFAWKWHCFCPRQGKTGKWRQFTENCVPVQKNTSQDKQVFVLIKSVVLIFNTRVSVI
jgi:hypothetical protein